MKNKHLIWIIALCLIVGAIVGMGVYVLAEDNLLMKGYDLYHCIYTNADLNNFNQNPVMIQKIQDECVWFYQNNHTDYIGNAK